MSQNLATVSTSIEIIRTEASEIKSLFNRITKVNKVLTTPINYAY